MTMGRLLAAVQGATKAVAKGRNSSSNSGRNGIAGGWNTRCGPIRSQNRPLRLNRLPTTSEGQPFRGPADIAVANTCWQPPGRLPAIRLPVLGCEWCSGQLNLRPRPPSMCAPRGHLRVREKLGRRGQKRLGERGPDLPRPDNNEPQRRTVGERCSSQSNGLEKSRQPPLGAS